MKILMLLLALVAGSLNANTSLSLFASTGMGFTNQTDAPDTHYGQYSWVQIGDPMFNEWQVNYGVNKSKLSIGNMNKPASLDLGVTYSWDDNHGIELGFSQTFNCDFRTAISYYAGSQGNRDMTYTGSMVVQSFYIAPYLRIPQSGAGFCDLSIKVGQANMTGGLEAEFQSPQESWTASYKLAESAIYFEPTIRQGWYISKNTALSLEFSYTFLQYNNVNMSKADNFQSSNGMSVFMGTPPIPQNDIDIDASHCGIKIRIDTLLMNGYKQTQTPMQIPPDPPVIAQKGGE